MKNNMSSHTYHELWAWTTELRYRFYCIFVLIKFIAVVFSQWLTCYEVRAKTSNITSCAFKNWHKCPSNYKLSQFWNVSFLPIISPSEYKPLSKISPSKKGPFKNISFGVYFRNFTVLCKTWLERYFAIVLFTNMAVSSREWKPRIECFQSRSSRWNVSFFDSRNIPNKYLAMWVLEPRVSLLILYTAKGFPIDE